VVTGPKDARDKLVREFDLEKHVMEVMSIEHGDYSMVYTFTNSYRPPKRIIVEVMAVYPLLRYSVKYAEQAWNFYGRFGSSGPTYHCEFRDADYDSNQKLVGELADIQDLYDMSG